MFNITHPVGDIKKGSLEKRTKKKKKKKGYTHIVQKKAHCIFIIRK